MSIPGYVAVIDGEESEPQDNFEVCARGLLRAVSELGKSSSPPGVMFACLRTYHAELACGKLRVWDKACDDLSLQDVERELSWSV